MPVCDKPQNPLLGATTMTSGKKGASKAHHTHRGEPAGQGRGGVRRRRARGALVRSELHRRAGYAVEVTQEWYDAGFTTEDARACLEFLDWAAGFDGDNATGASWVAETGAASFL